MADIEHWLVLHPDPEAETFIAWDATTADDHRQRGCRVDGPFVDPATYRGAVEALERLVAWWDENSDLPDEVAFARTVLADLNQPGGR